MNSHNIHILIPWPHDPEDLDRSNMASIRLRSAVAFKSLSDLGHKLTVGEQVPGHTDIVLVGKIGAHNILTRSRSWLDSIMKAKERGSKLFLDYTDHHLGFDSAMRDFYQNALAIVDYCITSSEELRIKLRDLFTGDIHVIEEPVEIHPSSPKTAAKVKTVLWFGHASNVGYLIQWLEDLPASDSFNLIGLTNESGVRLFSDHRFYSRNNVRVKLIEWSVESMIQASKHADLCVIPSNIDDPRKVGASSNRLLTALALGLPTAATMLPSYREFAEYFLNLEFNPLTLNIEELKRLTDAVAKAQASVVPNYSRERIGQKWVELFKAS